MEDCSEIISFSELPLFALTWAVTVKFVWVAINHEQRENSLVLRWDIQSTISSSISMITKSVVKLRKDIKLVSLEKIEMKIRKRDKT